MSTLHLALELHATHQAKQLEVGCVHAARVNDVNK